MLNEYARLPREERTPTLEDPARAQPPKRPVPQPPAGGLIVPAHAIDAHGAGKFGNALSTRFYEVYHNTLNSATPREAGAGGFAAPDFAMAFRGGEGVVFEHNGEIVPKSRYAQTRITAGDKLEIVHFVGGGI